MAAAAGDLVGLAVHEVGEGEARVEAMLVAPGPLGDRGDGNRLGHDDLGLGRLLVQHQVHAEGAAGDALDARLDLVQQVRPHPAEHVVIGCEQQQLLAVTLGAQWLDPGVELLRRQLLFELSGERWPKRIHERSGGDGGRGRAGSDYKFYLDRRDLSTAATN
jgi:hypothetical protein